MGTSVLSRCKSGNHLDVDIRINDKEYAVYYESNCNLTYNNEHAIASVLIPSMSVGADIALPGTVSKRFFDSNERIQEILDFWYPNLSKVQVAVDDYVITNPDKKNNSVGTFFSGGVDSYYTLLKHREEITHLIYVHGFDVPHTNNDLGEKVLDKIRYISDALGVKLVMVKTNLRDLLDKHANWEWTHGSALAAVGFLLAGDFKKIYIPSSHTYDHLSPWGSHPLLDVLWSDDNLEFNNDGSEANRNLKIEFITKLDLVLDTLRVCWRNPNNSYNCSECEKCLRTMICMRVAGVLDKSKTFRSTLDLRRIRKLSTKKESKNRFIEDSIRYLDQKGNDPALRKALRIAHIKNDFRIFGEKMMILIRDVFNSNSWFHNIHR